MRGTLRMLWNSYSFFILYARVDGFEPTRQNEKSENILDRWILSELNILIEQVNQNMEKYDLATTSRLFAPFVDNLSNWFIRRSRDRFWKPAEKVVENESHQKTFDGDKENSYNFV